MSKQEEIIEVAGKRVRVAYRKPGEDCCARCCFNGGETCVGLIEGEEWPCGKFNLATAYFVEAEQPEEEAHSLREWAQILATNPDLRAEFDKMCPPQPIRGSIAPEADLEAEIERWWNERYAKLKKDYKFDSMSGHYLDNETIIDLARHFAEWGAEHLKK